MNLALYKKCISPPCRGGLYKKEAKKVAKQMGIKIPRGASKSDIAALIARVHQVGSGLQPRGQQVPTMYQSFPSNLLQLGAMQQAVGVGSLGNRPLPSLPPNVPPPQKQAIITTKALPAVPDLGQCIVSVPRKCNDIRIRMV